MTIDLNINRSLLIYVYIIQLYNKNLKTMEYYFGITNIKTHVKFLLIKRN